MKKMSIMSHFVISTAVVCLSMACFAEWKPVGSLQVASSKAMAPQIGTLAAKTKFPLLPMVVPQVLAETDMAQWFGSPREDEDYGSLFFKEGTEFCQVMVWPLAGEGLETWRKAHPKKKIVDGVVTYKHKASDEPGERHEAWKEYAVFSGDGRRVFVSENLELAKRVAQKNAPFASPLTKGFLCVTLEGTDFFDDIENLLENAEEQAKTLGKELMPEMSKKDVKADEDDADTEEFSLFAGDFPSSQFSSFIGALAKELQKVRFVVGVSQTGFDIRMRVTPREGASLARPGGILSEEAMTFPGAPASSVFAFVGVPILQGSAVAPAWNRFLDDLFSITCSRFGKKAEQVPDDASFQAFTAFLGFFSHGTSAFRSSGAKSAYTLFALAENDHGNKFVQFRAVGLDKPVVFNETPPKPQKVDKKDPGMAGTLRTAADVFEIGGIEEGFQTGAQDEIGKAFAAALPERNQTKQPLLAARGQTNIELGERRTAVSVWLFGWRDQTDYRALVRVPLDDLASIVSAAFGMAMGAGKGE